ncbi:MAG: hypothetical protein ACI4NM_09605 [Bullifex sp.]
MKKVLCMVLLVLTVMMSIAAKTESCTLTLRAVVAEKTTFTMTDDGFCTFSSNASSSSYSVEAFDAFGGAVEIADGRLAADGGNITLCVTAK